VGGQVVGIAVQAPALSGRGGFGLNVADVTDDVNQMIQSGRLVVPSIGASTIDVPTERAALSGLPAGTQVVALDKGGPAAAAGIQVGDVITQIDDVDLDSAHPLDLLLRSRFHPNQRVTITYSRGGASTQAQMTLVGGHPSCS
jgi:S1-C subfamily serine protease